jgi:hypothetical protein
MTKTDLTDDEERRLNDIQRRLFDIQAQVLSLDPDEFNTKASASFGKEDTESQSLRPLYVFLCHSSADKPTVRKLSQRLQDNKVLPWLDEEDILPGQDWDREIKKAVRKSDIILVCCSTSSVTKAGYIQKEIRFALDIADEKLEGEIFIIPVRLENCDVPERLTRWQWVDLFLENGYEKLLRALRARAEDLGTLLPI